MKNSLAEAIQIFKSGGVGVFPTDTVYGIGCRLDNPEAVKRIFTLRKRPEEKAVLAVVDSVAMAEEYVLPITQEVKKTLITKYWPGGLTIIVPCLIEKVPSVVRANGTTLAIRQTNHPIILQILKELKVPLIAPSANFAGGITPTSFSELDPQLLQLVDCAIDGRCGGNKPSTIIDCSVTPWKVIREGAVKVTV